MLFGKKHTPSFEERMAACRHEKAWGGLARLCYERGAAAMDKGELNEAVLWLHRADTIFSARDEVYDKVGGRLVDDCSDRIGRLEEEALLYNDFPRAVEEKAQECIGKTQVRVWGLLSLSRLVQLGRRLGQLPGCQALGQLDWAVDMVLKSFQEPITQEEFDGLKDLCGALYELGDSEAFFGGGEIEVPHRAPFEVFDLNGMMGVHLEIDAYLDSHLHALTDPEQSSPELGIISCTLLPDYYVRTVGGRLETVSQIKAEMARIWGDCRWLCSGVSWEQVSQRVAEYRMLDILA